MNSARTSGSPQTGFTCSQCMNKKLPSLACLTSNLPHYPWSLFNKDSLTVRRGSSEHASHGVGHSVIRTRWVIHMVLLQVQGYVIPKGLSHSCIHDSSIPFALKVVSGHFDLMALTQAQLCLQAPIASTQCPGDRDRWQHSPRLACV